ncbi:trimeric intracellular cation channel family protein [Haloarcula sp. 1CSR25-25]|nr:trimeric intracellular cation channel family protein [Haloarcula sp. 1CSR25-25]
MNIIGLLAFAIVGSLKGVEADLDLLGVVILGVITALGGGTLRDLLVQRVPNSLQSSTDMSLALFGVGIALIGVWYVEDLVNHPLVTGSDAVGLATFATTGALVGHSAGVSPFGIAILAMVTGVGGGSMADLVRGRIPFVLVEDFYATCALAGGVVFWFSVWIGATTQSGAFGCAATTLMMRLLAIHRGWHLPKMSRVQSL